MTKVQQIFHRFNKEDKNVFDENIDIGMNATHNYSKVGINLKIRETIEEVHQNSSNKNQGDVNVHLINRENFLGININYSVDRSKVIYTNLKDLLNDIVFNVVGIVTQVAVREKEENIHNYIDSVLVFLGIIDRVRDVQNNENNLKNVSKVVDNVVLIFEVQN